MPLGLTCPACGSTRLLVRDTQPAKNAKRRRRCCHDCGHLFSTLEVCEAAAGTAARQRIGQGGHNRLSPEKVEEINTLLLAGKSIRAIARELGAAQVTVDKYRRKLIAESSDAAAPNAPEGICRSEGCNHTKQRNRDYCAECLTAIAEKKTHERAPVVAT